jgi:pimeloyl-ACP methyl ester carboxylesterase
MVDALSANWSVVAPDWRGYGLSAWSGADCYWFPDYLADLEGILDAVVGDEPATLIGHSMGANVAMLYAGSRPHRVRAIVNLEGFGLRATRPSDAPGRYAQWLDQLKSGMELRDYATLEAVIERLQRTNPRLAIERAQFLAPHWAQQSTDGRWKVAGDPAHRIVNPTLYQIDEVLACWAAIECPVLWIMAQDTEVLRHVAGSRDAAVAELERRREVLRDVEVANIDEAGHMVHHDQPGEVARLIEDFLRRHTAKVS